MVLCGILKVFCWGVSFHVHSTKPFEFAKVGTNNIISKALRNKAQRSFQPVKAQRKLRHLIFLISEAQRNFCTERFDLVKAQRNSTIAERHFCTKLKRNLTSAIKIAQHNANTAFFAILTEKEQIIC